MFSLIISIISIALVAALAAATVYFGGAAFNKGGAGADASTFINGAQQISGAFTLAETDNAVVSTVEELKDKGYLSQVPSFKGNQLVLDTSTDGYVTLVNDINANICEEINKRANGADEDGVVADVTDIDGLYGCVTADLKAFYKVANVAAVAPEEPELP